MFSVRPLVIITFWISLLIAPALGAELPGVVVNHIPSSSKIYVGSPGIAVLPNGDYVATHDEFGPGSTERSSAVTRVFRSNDRGKTWAHLATVEGMFWASVFVHKGSLYLMGTNKHHGFAVIRRSGDGGRTWTSPKDKRSGLLLDIGKYHCAPVPVVVHEGRLWRAMEDAMGLGGWGSHFRAFMMSAPADANLLDASNWTCSNRLARNSEWLGGKFGGWLEGNAVVTPDGNIVNVLRVDYRPEGGKAAIIQISRDGKTASFNPDTGFIDFPGGCKKFTIRYDSVSKLYWTLTNPVLPKHRDPDPSRVRNAVALMSSPDLQSWTIRSVVLYHPDVERHGFQYLDWLFEGSDIIAVSRTAFGTGAAAAPRQHDANYLTFHRIKDFRNPSTGSGQALTMPDSAGNSAKGKN